MRKWMSFLMTFLVGASSYANANVSTVALEFSYRQDNIHLTNHLTENFETRQNFRDLDIFQIGAKGKFNLCYNLYLRASGSWGWVLDGRFDNKFLAELSGSDGSLDFTRTVKNVADDRYVFDGTVALGYPFYFCDCTVSFAPTVGYSFDEQNLRVDVCNTESSSGSNFAFQDNCCKHKFINRWFGPFIGVDLEYRPYNESWNLYAELEFHWARYKGRRQDGFIADGFHEVHSRHGHGVVFNIGAEYDFCNEWTTGLAVKFTDFRAHRNKHHFSSGSESESDFSGGFDHNGVKAKWRSYAVTASVGRAF